MTVCYRLMSLTKQQLIFWGGEKAKDNFGNINQHVKMTKEDFNNNKVEGLEVSKEEAVGLSPIFKS